MKILFVIDTNLKVGAGIERTLLKYISFMHKDDITILQNEFHIYSRIDIPDQYPQNNIKIINYKNYVLKFGFLKKNGLGLLIYRLILPFAVFITYLLNRDIFGRINRSDFDIVYLFKNEYWSLFKGRVIIGSNHAEFSSYGYATRVFAKLIRNRLIYRGIKAYHLFPKAAEIGSMIGRPFFITPVGIDIDLFLPGDRSDKKLNVFLVSRLEYIKGIDVLLDIARKCSGIPDIMFHVAGIGAYSEQLRSTMLPNLRYYGNLSDRDLRDLYSKCDIFLYPTRWDAFPSVIIEALSSGEYILASDFLKGTFDDLVKNGFMEYVKNEPDAYCSRLMDILTRIDEIRNRSAEARAYAATHYDNRSIIDTIRTNFLSLMDRMSE